MVRRKTIFIEYSITEKDSKSPTSSTSFLHTTNHGMWMPIGFAASEMYNFEKGTPLDKKTCEKNLEKLVKYDREVDYHEWLNLAQQCRTENQHLMEKMAFGMAFTSAMSNKLHKQVGEKTDDRKPTGSNDVTFLIESAGPWDREVVLDFGDGDP